ncbi:MAG: aldose 1-epimerase family protein [Clostridia bacterium]|nr:aldose 1-epimerase family protein [Clostridia bacterium]
MEHIKLSYKGCTAEVQLAGAQLASFKGTNGREVIWQADPAVWPQHGPIMFPVCGTARDAHIKIGGVTYDMPKHGFVRTAPFEVARIGEDFVELVLGRRPETDNMYPFDFVLHVTYTLFENGVTCTFLVENKGSRVMPFCIGGHPGFNVPMADGAAYEDYQIVFEKQEEGINSLAPGGGIITAREKLTELADGKVLPLNHALFDERDALLLEDINSRSVDVVHKDTGKGIHFAFPKFPMLAIWSMPKKNAPYLCLEPWIGTPEHAEETNTMEEKPHVIKLEPGRCFKAWFTVSLI